MYVVNRVKHTVFHNSKVNLAIITCSFLVMHRLSAKYRKSAYRPYFYNTGNWFFSRCLANHYKVMYLTKFYYETKRTLMLRKYIKILHKRVENG